MRCAKGGTSYGCSSSLLLVIAVMTFLEMRVLRCGSCDGPLVFASFHEAEEQSRKFPRHSTLISTSSGKVKKHAQVMYWQKLGTLKDCATNKSQFPMAAASTSRQLANYKARTPMSNSRNNLHTAYFNTRNA